jgi:hypothetical protein
MSALGHYRKLWSAQLTSALPLRSDIGPRRRHVGKVPEAEQYQTIVNQPVAIRTKLHHNETATKCSVCQQ